MFITALNHWTIINLEKGLERERNTRYLDEGEKGYIANNITLNNNNFN